MISGKIAILKEMDGSNNNAAKTSLFLLIFIASAFFGITQSPPLKDDPKKMKVTVVNTDSLEMQTNNSLDILRGNVVLLFDSVLLYCDSAYYYSGSNSLEAYDNVRIIQGDSIFITGDYLNYNGDAQLAKIRKNVKMENNEGTLFTDSFDYDRKNNIAYYFDGGVLVDSVNELTSVYGQYSPDTKTALFKNQVRLVNPKYILTSDSLTYFTETNIASFTSSTVIESDSGFIYTDTGWFNTATGESMLYNRSLVVSRDETKTITADTISYFTDEGYLEAFGNFIMNDTIQKVIILGNYGFYDENKEFAFATDLAQLIEYSQQDSSFIHADTLLMVTVDSVKEIRAYHGVRFYRVDLQGVCDSLQYNTADSIMRLYKNPIIWNDAYQITGDTINILFNDSTIEKMNVLNYAFAIQKIDSTYYNQLKGRNLTAYFDAGDIHCIEVEGNGQTVYYNLGGNASPLELSKAEAPFITFWVKQRAITQIKFFPMPKQVVFPIPDLNPEEKFLQNFVDYNYLRPKNREDIFVKTEMKTEDVPPARRTRQSSRLN